MRDLSSFDLERKNRSQEGELEREGDIDEDYSQQDAALHLIFTVSTDDRLNKYLINIQILTL